MRALVRLNQLASFFHGINVVHRLRMMWRRCGDWGGSRRSACLAFLPRFFSTCKRTEVFAHLFSDVVFQGARMRTFLGQPQQWKVVEDGLALYFQFSRELIDTNWHFPF